MDKIRITIEGARCKAYGNLIMAALEQGVKNFSDSIVRNLAENTHVEIIQREKTAKRFTGAEL